jgi:hypothetical protein
MPVEILGEGCQVALTAHENDGELPPGWSTRSRMDDGLDNEALCSDEAPDPPDTLNVFDFQRWQADRMGAGIP